MRFMLESELADSLSPVTEQYGAGWQTLDQWQALAEMLQKFDALPALDVEKAFTTEILKAAQSK
jgi:putative hydroxymethylpyrimidine transport system substrate-binding protein